MTDFLVPIHVPTEVSFCTFTGAEVLKSSVLEVNNPQTFDALGHPTKGGLYDPKLGPTESDEVCGSCNQSSARCLGHVGHISLPLPVFNPVFIRLAFQFLKGTCFSCGRFRTNPMSSQLALAQLKALSYGLIQTAKEMEMTFGEMGVEDEESNKLQLDVLTIKDKLERMLKAALEGIDPEAAKKESMIKNVMEFRNAITRAFMRDHINNAPRKCFHCNTPKRNLTLEYNSRLIIGPSSTKSMPAVKKKEKIKHEADEFGRNICADTDYEAKEEEYKDFKQVYLTPKEAQEHLLRVFNNERDIMTQLFGGNFSPIDGLFLEVLPVIPSRFRPLARMGEDKFENPQSTVLNRVVQDCIIINHLLFALKSGNEEFAEDVKDLLTKTMGQTAAEKLQTAWFALQTHVNAIFDGNLDKLNVDKIPGIKQILERKSGLFRMHMMGKRVNYVCRSVISPDPYIDVDEVGVPEIFAKKLTYPQPVTPWNIKELRQAVCNGPDVYPGATLVKNEDGSVTFLGRQRVQREAIAKQLLTPSLNSQLISKCKIVYRHMRTGDIMLLNRQPSLHKPSIMAHKVRVLFGERTLRMNYSNCKSYNADFDGDEMNAHLPQSEVARAEAHCIANVTNQYLVPKDGTPLGGLIQDHIIGASLLMIRGKFFCREDYQHLVFCACNRKDDKLLLLPPAIRKPSVRWSGKQVISTVIINTIPTGKHLLSLNGKSKIPLKCWQTQPARQWLAGGSLLRDLQMTESEVVIRQGELLCGILDKAHVGPTPYSMIHCCYELYGGDVAGQMLSQLARLFTHFLQIEGFSLGVEDILVTPKANKRRCRIMERSQRVGDSVASEALRLPETTDEATLKDKLAVAHLGQDERPMKDWDMCMKHKTDTINNDINSACMPDGLLKKFPDNHLQLMVLSGAKGATVNCMQISCLLGQIELEGRRPPLMISGSSLPSFVPYDTSPRAGGFVTGRFLSGIRPQEFFFHCMAGREGLIDTAVKTSRSGYLQRCLIKHLEGLLVAYDLSVRDSDGSIVQFQYGEDALDIPKLPFLKEEQFSFIEANSNAYDDKFAEAKVLQDSNYKNVLKLSKKVRRWLAKNSNEDGRNRLTGFLKFAEFNLPELKQKYQGVNPATQRALATEKLMEMWNKMEGTDKTLYNDQLPKVLDPIASVFRPDTALGAISENIDSRIESYLKKHTAAVKVSPRQFRKVMHHKVMTSVCEPGESVGLLAAQSIGEPSTQMTLNTFHFAGRGEMNVTLGIPRLREILMTASASIATPSLAVPFLPLNKLEKKANNLRLKLTQVPLSEVVESVKIREKIVIQRSKKCRIYTLRFNFGQYKLYKKYLHITPAKVLHFMENTFFKHLMRMIKLKIHIMEQSTLVSNISVRDKEGPMAETGEDMEKAGGQREADDGDSSDEDRDHEPDSGTIKIRARRDQESGYEEVDEEDKQIQNEGIESGDEEDAEAKADNNNSRPSTPTPDEEFSRTSDRDMFADSDDFVPGKLDAETTNRVANVIDSSPWINNYKFDTECNQWCELTFSLDLLMKKVDLSHLVKDEVRKGIVHRPPGIKRAFIVNEKNAQGKSETVLKTDGVNIGEVFKYDHLLDLPRLYSNDIHAIAQTYGIEMAARIIVKEIQNVFRVYGIEVDPRHLLLIADYMTFDGSYKPFNRLGIESSASPLQQMSFETTMYFLKLAAVSGLQDKLKSPSACLALGRPAKCGTGSFELIADLSK